MDRSSFKKFLCPVFAFLICAMPAYCLELDMSVDEEIRKHYNPSQLELDTLPPLPDTPKTTVPVQSPKTTTQVQPSASNTSPPKTLPAVDTSSRVGRVHKTLPRTDASADAFTAIKINQGTKFKVVSKTKVSSWTPEGARMSFVSLAPVTRRT